MNPLKIRFEFLLSQAYMHSCYSIHSSSMVHPCACNLTLPRPSEQCLVQISLHATKAVATLSATSVRMCHAESLVHCLLYTHYYYVPTVRASGATAVALLIY